MLEWFWSLFDWLKSLFFQQEIEITLVGLQNSGKTTLVSLLATGNYRDDMIPTVGFNVRIVKKGSVTIKMWDLAGQPRFRSMWDRYCRGVNAILFVVDASDPDKFALARRELHDLLAKAATTGIPTLVLGNKNDLPGAKGVEDLIRELHLEEINTQEVCCYSISAKENVNIDVVLQWLMDRAKRPRRIMSVPPALAQ